MNAALLCLCARSLSPFFAIRSGQPKGEPPLADFKDGKKITGIRLSPDTRYFAANPA